MAVSFLRGKWNSFKANPFAAEFSVRQPTELFAQAHPGASIASRLCAPPHSTLRPDGDNRGKA